MAKIHRQRDLIASGWGLRPEEQTMLLEGWKSQQPPTQHAHIPTLGKGRGTGDRVHS